jgi:hypothetical protein
MSSIPCPHDFDIDHDAERRWQREQAIIPNRDRPMSAALSERSPTCGQPLSGWRSSST